MLSLVSYSFHEFLTNFTITSNSRNVFDTNSWAWPDLSGTACIWLLGLAANPWHSLIRSWILVSVVMCLSLSFSLSKSWDEC